MRIKIARLSETRSQATSLINVSFDAHPGPRMTSEMDARPGPEDATTSRHVLLPPAPRVSQVDADELDEGLVGMLAEKVERSMGNIRVG